jgi:chemotaxis signal transduction protein
MTNQDSKPALNIDFSHRLAITDYLTDSVGLIVDRAHGVLSILAMQFHESKNTPIFQADHITAAAMDSVLCDLEDIKNLVNAHYERSKKA